MSAPLAGRTAVVTGAGAGIGRATAARLHRDGAHVLLVDRSAEGLDATAAALDGNASGELRAVAVDLTDPDAAAAVAAAAPDGRIDVLVNVAGVPGPTKPMIDCDDAEVRAVFEVNVFGAWRMIRAAVPLMLQQGGVIVNIASTVGIKAAPLVSIYGASKQALISLSKSAAVELAGRGIRVNAVCPGTVATAMTDHIHRSLDPEAPNRIQERFTRGVPLRRYGTPEEIAGLVGYLASDDAGYVTGAVYLIDGGATVA